MKALAFLPILLLLLSHCSAGLGESEAQSDARYGTPTVVGVSKDTGLLQRTYQANEILVELGFLNGVVVWETFRKVGGGQLSEAEIFGFMKESAGGRKWILAQGLVGKSWRLDDKSASAKYSASSPLSIMTAGAADFISKFLTKK